MLETQALPKASEKRREKLEKRLDILEFAVEKNFPAGCFPASKTGLFFVEAVKGDLEKNDEKIFAFSLAFSLFHALLLIPRRMMLIS